MKRTPIKSRSKKRKELYKERGPLVQDMLTENQWCLACLLWRSFDLFKGQAGSAMVNPNQTVDVHELINRSQGGSITDRRNLLAVCRPCHRRITENPSDAEILGMHLQSWCNTDEHFTEAEFMRDQWRSGKPSIPFWLKG